MRKKVDGRMSAFGQAIKLFLEGLRLHCRVKSGTGGLIELCSPDGSRRSFLYVDRRRNIADQTPPDFCSQSTEPDDTAKMILALEEPYKVLELLGELSFIETNILLYQERMEALLHADDFCGGYQMVLRLRNWFSSRKTEADRIVEVIDGMSAFKFDGDEHLQEQASIACLIEACPSAVVVTEWPLEVLNLIEAIKARIHTYAGLSPKHRKLLWHAASDYLRRGDRCEILRWQMKEDVQGFLGILGEKK